RVRVARLRGAQCGRGLRRAVVARPGGRLRNRWQPRAADGRLGPLDRWPRPRDVPQAGDDAAPDARGARTHPPDGRGARRGRGHAGAHRGGPAVMRSLAPEFSAYTWATPTDEVAALAGIDVAQVIRFEQNDARRPLTATHPGTHAKENDQIRAQLTRPQKAQH